MAIATALAITIGLHWAFLQSVAWVSMVVCYSQEDCVCDALVKTFDGKHPCCLCTAIAKCRQSEKKPESAPVLKKFECSYSPAALMFSAPSAWWEPGWPQPLGSSLTQAPPSPPPRQLPGQVTFVG
jgi:hypothetical protein